jgi:hypothetical protein
MLPDAAVIPTPHPLAPATSPAQFLDVLGDLAGERALLLRPDEDLAAALRLGGCSVVHQIAGDGHFKPAEADVAIIPDLGPDECVTAAIAQARRALAGSGRVLVGISAAPHDRIALTAAAALRRSGFSAIRTVHRRDRTVVTAEVPFFGPCLRA